MTYKSINELLANESKELSKNQIAEKFGISPEMFNSLVGKYGAPTSPTERTMLKIMTKLGGEIQLVINEKI